MSTAPVPLPPALRLAEMSPADTAALTGPWRAWLDTESRVKSDS